MLYNLAEVPQWSGESSNKTWGVEDRACVSRGKTDVLAPSIRSAFLMVSLSEVAKIPFPCFFFSGTVNLVDFLMAVRTTWTFQSY